MRRLAQNCARITPMATVFITGLALAAFKDDWSRDDWTLVALALAMVFGAAAALFLLKGQGR